MIVSMYGAYEYDIPLEYAGNVCCLCAILGVRGINDIFATGNRDVGEGERTV